MKPAKENFKYKTQNSIFQVIPQKSATIMIMCRLNVPLKSRDSFWIKKLSSNSK